MINAKKLIGTMLLAGAVGQASAEVDVAFYGLLDVWAGSAETPAAADATAQLGAGGMSTSYLGSRITYALPNGLKGLASVEMFLRPDSGEQGRYGSDELFARNAYVGLEGNFGLVKAGRVTAPYFLPVVFSNAFGDSFVFSPAILHSFQGGNFGAVMGDSGWSNAVSYSTPNLNGLTATVMYAFGEQSGDDGENKVGGNLIYRSGKLLLVAAAHRVREGALNSGGGAGERGGLPGATDQEAVMVGASYDAGWATLFAQYHSFDTTTLTDHIDADTYQLGASVPVGQGKLLLAYGHSEYSGDLDSERDTWSVGYDYVLSKQVDLYTVFTRDDIDGIGDGNTYGVGGRFRF